MSARNSRPAASFEVGFLAAVSERLDPRHGAVTDGVYGPGSALTQITLACSLSLGCGVVYLRAEALEVWQIAEEFLDGLVDLPLSARQCRTRGSCVLAASATAPLDGYSGSASVDSLLLDSLSSRRLFRIPSSTLS